MLSRLHFGDCREVLLNYEGVFDSCVTDPPYGIKFRGTSWDNGVPPSSVWEVVYHSMKPGAFLVSFFGARTYHRGAVAIEDAGFEIKDMLNWMYSSGFPQGNRLKPAHEPIVLAKKPGSGFNLNIDSCRLDCGRWPANIIHDNSDEVVSMFPNAKSGGSLSGVEASSVTKRVYGKYTGRRKFDSYNDSGSASRFFYGSKATKKDRGEYNCHGTVKPTDVMTWLCNLITPTGGTILDPFMGSGSTGKAAMCGGYDFTGIEISQESYDIAVRRMSEIENNIVVKL